MSNHSLFKITNKNYIQEGKFESTHTPKIKKRKEALSPPPQIPDMKKYPFLNQIRNLTLETNEHLNINKLIQSNGQIKKTFPNNEILTVSELNDTNTAFSSDMFSDNQSIGNMGNGNMGNQPIRPNFVYCANSDNENYPSVIQDEKIKLKKKKFNDDIGILIDYKMLSLSFIERYNKEKAIKEEEEYSVDRLPMSKTEDNQKKHKRLIDKRDPNGIMSGNTIGSIGSIGTNNNNTNTNTNNSANVPKKKASTIASILFQQNNNKPCPVGIQPKKKIKVNIPTEKDYINKKQDQEVSLSINIQNIQNCNSFNKKQKVNPITIRTPDRKIIDNKYPEIDIRHHSNKKNREDRSYIEKSNFFFSSSNNLYEKVFGTGGNTTNSTPTNISQQRTNFIRKSYTNNNTAKFEKQEFSNKQIYFNNNENKVISPINYNNKNNPFPLMMPPQFNQINNNNQQFLNFNDQNLNYMYPHLNYPYTGNQVFRDNFNLDYNFGKIVENFSPFPYTFKLHNDIVEYSNNVTSVINELKDIKNFVVNFITDQIKNLISKLNNITN